MKTKVKLSAVSLVVILVLAACSAAGQQVVPTVVNVTSPPRPTEIRVLPTPMPGGQAVVYQDLQVAFLQAQITAAYETEFGSMREPTLDGKFLWVQVEVQNLSAASLDLPALEHFSAVLNEQEFKPSYGYRKDHPDYSTLKTSLSPGQKEAAWLRFDIPADAELPDLQFVYLPRSFQVSFSFPSSGYSWADHPQYFWRCAP